MESTRNFYTKFINEENFKQIDDIKIYNRFLVRYLFMIIFAILSVSIVSFSGFNFEHWIPIYWFVLALIFLLLSLRCAMRLVYCDKKYRVFIKHWHLISFILAYFVLIATFYIVAFFTTNVTVDETTGALSIVSNVAFYFILFWPLNIVYICITYYSFAKCFAKYVAKASHSKGTSEKLQIENKEENVNDESLNAEISKHFYNKFVDEDNLRNVGDIRAQQKFYRCGSQIPWYVFLSVIWITLNGYKFEEWYNILSFVLSIIFLLLVLLYAIGLILLDNKYHVFKKRRYPYMFISIYFILLIAFYVLAYFDIIYVLQLEEEALDLNLNYVFFWFIFTPLLIVYSSFCKRAYNKCFLKYTERGINLSQNTRLNQSNENINENESNDDDHDPHKE